MGKKNDDNNIGQAKQNKDKQDKNSLKTGQAKNVDKDTDEKNENNKGDDGMNGTIERYCPVTESLEKSLKEMKAMREGKMPKKTWRQYRDELKEERKRNNE